VSDEGSDLRRIFTPVSPHTGNGSAENPSPDCAHQDLFSSI
jgi:hypothetical protein